MCERKQALQCSPLLQVRQKVYPEILACGQVVEHCISKFDILKVSDCTSNRIKFESANYSSYVKKYFETPEIAPKHKEEWGKQNKWIKVSRLLNFKY